MDRMTCTEFSIKIFRNVFYAWKKGQPEMKKKRENICFAIITGEFIYFKLLYHIHVFHLAVILMFHQTESHNTHNTIVYMEYMLGTYYETSTFDTILIEFPS